jgi:CRP-like cAMP-binding protein
MESALIASMAIGSLSMPILMATVGLRTGLAVIGGSVTLLTVVGLRGLRRIDTTALAPEGLALIMAVPFFTPLSRRVKERLARASSQVSFSSGTVVFSEGDSGDHFYIVETGAVEVAVGGEPVRTLGPGDFFGEIALLTDVPRTATITAVSDVTALTLERDEFLGAVTGHGAAMNTARAVATRYTKHV